MQFCSLPITYRLYCLQGAWVYLIETDFLFVKPVVAPGPAESPVRPLGFWYSYIYADAQPLQVNDLNELSISCD